MHNVLNATRATLVLRARRQVRREANEYGCVKSSQGNIEIRYTKRRAAHVQARSGSCVRSPMESISGPSCEGLVSLQPPQRKNTQPKQPNLVWSQHFLQGFCQHIAFITNNYVFQRSALANSFIVQNKTLRRAIHSPSSTKNADNLTVFCASPLLAGFSSAMQDLSGNHIFMSAFLSWLLAQIAKLFTSSYREGTWDYKVMFDSGGMPSSHTALVVGLTTAIVHQYGLGSVYFPLSLVFTLIVMYDAAGVRRHAGKQAEVLNKIVEDLFHGSAISDKKLKEVLGHSPLQVTCGAILGVTVGSVYMLKFSH
jgi:acid phosphatase family membrane protein YuiD